MRQERVRQVDEAWRTRRLPLVGRLRKGREKDCAPRMARLEGQRRMRKWFYVDITTTCHERVAVKAKAMRKFDGLRGGIE